MLSISSSLGAKAGRIKQADLSHFRSKPVIAIPKRKREMHSDLRRILPEQAWLTKIKGLDGYLLIPIRSAQPATTLSRLADGYRLPESFHSDRPWLPWCLPNS